MGAACPRAGYGGRDFCQERTFPEFKTSIEAADMPRFAMYQHVPRAEMPPLGQGARSFRVHLLPRP